MEIIAKSTSYMNIRKRINSNEFRQTQLPNESYISLPIPTIFHNSNAFIMFTCPVSKNGNSVVYFKPDRWWVISAYSEKLLYYSLSTISPIDVAQEDSYIIESGHSLSQVKNAFKEIDNLMDVCIEGFFEGKVIEQLSKERLHSLLNMVIPSNIYPIYQTLASDFMAFLK